MTSYHVRVLYNTSIEIECPNDGVQFNKCVLDPGVCKVCIDSTAAIFTQFRVFNGMGYYYLE